MLVTLHDVSGWFVAVLFVLSLMWVHSVMNECGVISAQDL
jgi:hypothetical protein